MNKKVYIAPALCVHHVELQKMVCNSIGGDVGGDTGITNGGNETNPPVGGGDSRSFGGFFDDDDD